MSEVKDKVIGVVENYPGIDLPNLVRKSDYWIGKILNALDSLHSNRQIVVKEGFFYLPNQNFSQKYEYGEEEEEAEENKEILAKYRDIVNEKLESYPIYEQYRCTDLTNLRRYNLISKNNVSNKNLLFFGDDDLTSIILSLGKKDELGKIYVVEIDQRICKKIKNISEDHNLDIEVIHKDYRSELNLDKKIDIFFADPPGNIESVSTISYHINRLKTDRSTFYLSFPLFMTQMQREEFLKSINELGFCVDEIYENFNFYDNRCYFETYCSEKERQILKKLGYTKERLENSRSFMSYNLFVLKAEKNIKSDISYDIYSRITSI